MIKLITKIFDFFEAYWESKTNSRIQSYLLVSVFSVTVLIGAGNYFQLFKDIYLLSHIKFLDAIEFSFNFLLFFEMIGLAFVIPQSIANSIARQFQITSLILNNSFWTDSIVEPLD